MWNTACPQDVTKKKTPCICRYRKMCVVILLKHTWKGSIILKHKDNIKYEANIKDMLNIKQGVKLSVRKLINLLRLADENAIRNLTFLYCVMLLRFNTLYPQFRGTYKGWGREPGLNISIHLLFNVINFCTNWRMNIFFFCHLIPINQFWLAPYLCHMS